MMLPMIENEGLTRRELQVLGLVGQGLGNRAIADRLGLSANTIRLHLASIFLKLGVSTRTEAVATAVRRGIIHVT
jgi:DNA-binding NarL/FixJ family response regulator